MLNIRYRCFSQRGTGKAHNEDAVLIDSQIHQGSVREHGEFDTTRPRYFAIADGVSIGARPRTASRRLLELLKTRLVSAEKTAALLPLLHSVQHDYVALSDNAKFHGMASTLVGVRLVENSVTVFNVGDSRAYLLTRGELRLLSRDHSLLNDLLDDGEIAPEQAINASSIMHGLTCQFMADPEFHEFQVNMCSHELKPDSRLLLCSDGLNEVLSDMEIATLFAQGSDADLLNAYKASRRSGGTDDFSVIVLELVMGIRRHSMIDSNCG